MKDIAFGKRIKISKAQQQVILAVLGASLVFGVCVVLTIFFIRIRPPFSAHWKHTARPEALHSPEHNQCDYDS